MNYLLVALLVCPAFVHAGCVKPPEGFTALFNGHDLSGWYGVHGTVSPENISALSPEKQEAHKQASLAELGTHWTVENGELVNDGQGAYLATWKDYRDFELRLEYRTVPRADSGVYLRGCPQVQIWDPTEEGKFTYGADKGSGGLWNNSTGKPGKDPRVKMDKPFGEWNAMRVIMVGERVSVWLNGTLVVDDAVMENYFDRTRPVFPTGPMLLQTHGGEIRWRNLFVREIGSEEANDLLRARSGEGFTELFNGQDLSGWAGATAHYQVVDGSVMCQQGKGGTLYYDQEFADFVMRFEFLLPPGGNNGIAVRYSGQGDPAWKAYELQILDDTHPKYAKLKAYQFHGSVYGLLPAQRGYLRPVGEWNYEEIHFHGQQVKVVLNGTIILEGDLSKVDTTGKKRVPEGLQRSSGFLGFAGHDDPVRYRHIAVRPE